MTNLEITNHYNKLFEESIEIIRSDNYKVDNLIDSNFDNRFGITLLIRPSNDVKNEFQKFLSAVNSVEPKQYYYPSSDIHLTVIAIITCYNGFNLEGFSIQVM